MPEDNKAIDRFIVTFDGAKTIANVDDVRISLVDRLAAASDIIVDCSGLTELDLSFVQLLLSARRSARAQGKTLRLSAPAAGPLLDALRRGGLIQAGEDLPPSADAPFWMEAVP